MNANCLITLIGLFVFTTHSYACSCKHSSVAYMAHFYDNIVKVKIKQPTLLERFDSAISIDKNGEYKKYRIDVVENIKGKFIFDYVEASQHEDGNCGVKVDYGDTIYLIYQKSPIKPLIGMCNSVFENNRTNYIDKVKTYLQSPKESDKKIDMKDYALVSKDKDKQYYVNYKNKTVEDNYVTLWTLTNEIGTISNRQYKSFRAQIKISCEHKQYTLNSIYYYYAEKNATGNLANISQNEEEEIYDWKIINKGFPLYTVMKTVCKS